MSVVALQKAPPKVGSTVTVHEGTATGATVNGRLLGGLHFFQIPAARTHAAGVVNVRRSDKFLTATPIKAGGTDATHPTLGHSGAYSYDWQVVDRWLDNLDGAQAYVSLDSCPQLLGGSVAPFTGSSLTTLMPGHSQYAPEIPNDLTAFASMCVDVVHHCTVEKGHTLPYWGLWNEPAHAITFWRDPATGLAATASQWFAMYAAVAPALKAYNAALKVGGLDDSLAHFDEFYLGLMTYCKANAIPLDFLSWHDYSGTTREVAAFYAHIERAKTTVGWTDPLELMVGEWAAADTTNWPLQGSPFAAEYVTVNDRGACVTARQLMEMQRLGIVRSVFFQCDMNVGETAERVTGLFSQDGPWATGNVFRLWDRIGAAAVVTQELSADPGIHAMAAKRAGTLYVLLVSHHYRRGPVYPVTVNLPDTANGRVTTLTVIDRDHSNQFDAGIPNAELQTVGVEDVAASRVRLQLQARSVALLEVAP